MTISATQESAPPAAPRAASGIHSLPDGAEAFAARMAMAASAEESIDAQYYIWHPDLAGTLLFAQLVRAAERGVRVRLLLDDNNTRGMDPILAALEAQPNVEVRLFNPFKRRALRGLDYLLAFERMNRRMHNKSFTVDNQATIVGGRNVGDEYFGIGREISFEDLDVLAVGPVVAEVTNVFERYWNSESAVPVGRLVPQATREDVQRIVAKAEEIEASEPAARYCAAVAATPLARDLRADRLTLEWAETRLVSDPPSKVLASRRAVVAPVLDRLRDVLGSADREIDIVSPYFVPTKRGVAAFSEIASRGVKIRILTNSLAATDVAAVHAGYARYRTALLKAGIDLYELTPAADGLTTGKRGARGGSSGASLHAKAFAVDRCRAYVGSFNFDPRSARLNTEMGVVIESPPIAARIAARLDQDLRTAAYQVRCNDAGRLEWTISDASGERRFQSEPGASWKRRLGVRLLSLLPVERYL
jgi:putative cardiolipin synthase